MSIIYLDNNATSKVAPQVMEAMIPFLSDYYGNPSSIHRFGGQIRKKIDESREFIAKLLQCSPSEIIFTSCGTESNNAAFFSAVQSRPERKEIIISKVEHPAVLNTAQYYEKIGYTVYYIGVDNNGNLLLDDLIKRISNRTALISIMFANNETGVIFPIEEIGKICKEHDVLFHCDGVQGAGKIPIDVNNLSVDYFSLSGHKFHAPKGIGVLYRREGSPLKPFLIGGHQENGQRGGTEAAHNIIGIGKAAEVAMEETFLDISRVKDMRDYLENEIVKAIPKSFINGIPENRLYNTTNISFEGIEGESILLLLDEKGICASSGSACTTGSLEPSHVLRAMNTPFSLIHGSIRFSLSHYNTMEEITTTVSALKEIIPRLRSLSPFWKD